MLLIPFGIGLVVFLCRERARLRAWDQWAEARGTRYELAYHGVAWVLVSLYPVTWVVIASGRFPEVPQGADGEGRA